MFSGTVRNFTDLRTKSINFANSQVTCLHFGRFERPDSAVILKVFTFQQAIQKHFRAESRKQNVNLPSVQVHQVVNGTLSLPPSHSLPPPRLTSWSDDWWLINQVRGKNCISTRKEWCQNFSLRTQAHNNSFIDISKRTRCKRQHTKDKIINNYSVSILFFSISS